MKWILSFILMTLLAGCIAIKGDDWMTPQFDVDALTSTTLGEFHMANGNKGELRRTQNGRNQLKFFDPTGLAGKIYDINASNVSLFDSKALSDGSTVIVLKTPDFDCNHQYRIIYFPKNGDAVSVSAKGCKKMITESSKDNDWWVFSTETPNPYYPGWMVYKDQLKAVKDPRVEEHVALHKLNRHIGARHVDNTTAASEHAMSKTAFHVPSKVDESVVADTPVKVTLR
jgi:hypothetical protein